MEWTPLAGTAATDWRLAASSALTPGATAGEAGWDGLGAATCALLALMGVLDWRRWVGGGDEAEGTAAAAEEPERGSREWPCGGSPLLARGGVEGAEDEEAEEDEPNPNTRRNIRARARQGWGGRSAGEEGAPAAAAAVCPLLF